MNNNLALEKSGNFKKNGFGHQNELMIIGIQDKSIDKKMQE
jgi:hypothetical protein